MEFQNIEYSIFPLIILVLWSLEFWKIGVKPQLIASITRNNKILNLSRLFTYVIGLVGWLLLSYAMSGPRLPLKVIPSDIEVNDVMLVVDVSRSMLATDLRPNRLEVSKQKLQEFAALRPTDRIGVIIFSEKIFTMLPFTTDPTLIEKILGDIQIGYLGSGTNIGDALGLAVARAHESPTKNKVIILLTDGVSNVGNMTPIQAAEMAKEFNIKVYTIGVGGNENAQIPISNSGFGGMMQNIPGGSIDMETLKKISTMTGGKSYLAQTESSLEEILDDIQKLEKTEIKISNQVVYDEKFFPYLFFGVFSLLIMEILRRLWVREIV